MIFDVVDSSSDWLPGEFVYGDDQFVDDRYSEERWKPVETNPDYCVSDHGRVYSNRTKRFINGTPNCKTGHIDISFKYPNSREHGSLHRLVAEAFIPNPECYPIVRHLDDDPSNNHIDNLAWGTQTDNMQDAIRNGTFSYFSDEDRERAMQKRRMPITGVNTLTGEKRYFDSQQQASRELGINQTCIQGVVSGKRKTTHKWIFRKGGDLND